MPPISIKDYAKQKGVTYEAIRKQISRYKNELEGHIVVDHRRQLLDETAVAILDKHREGNPVIVYQQDKDEELQNLRDENNNLLKQTVALLNENKALIEKAGQIKLLEADNEAKAQKLADAEKSAQSANLKLSEATKAFEDKEQQLQAEIEQLRQQLEEKLKTSRKNEPVPHMEPAFCISDCKSGIEIAFKSSTMPIKSIFMVKA